MRSRLVAVAVALSVTACGEQTLSAFGNLDTPISLAIHETTSDLFIASHGSNDLRVYNVKKADFLVAPARLFPLSIPTVRSPIAVAAAEHFVFVVSGATAEVGFVTLDVPPGAFGPRSVDGPDGFPITQAIDAVPTAAVAFAAAFGFAEAEGGALADHLILAGLSPDGDGGKLVVVRPPHLAPGESGVEPLPSIVTELELPGVFPAGLAIDPTGLVVEGEEEPIPPAIDCRTVAIADSRIAEGHRPGVILTKARVSPDGAFSFDGPGETVEIRVPVMLPSGALEDRLAGARAVAFAPAPVTPALVEAVAADPCATRSGRLFVVLDPAYCVGALSCPNVAVLDLADEAPFGVLATDSTTGGPAAFQLPGAQLGLVAVTGPFTITGAFNPGVVDENGRALQAEGIPELTLFTSSDGALTYLAGGFGTFLEAPGVRADPDPVFLLSSRSMGPSSDVNVSRTDSRQRGVENVQPAVTVPAGARPRSEFWTAGFEIPLPGLEDVGSNGALAARSLRLPADASITFLEPVPVQASTDPLLADRAIPATFGDLVCDGFPIVSVSPDGRSIEVNLAAPGFVNPEGCSAGQLHVGIFPPKGMPWTLAGSVTGFVGRIPNETSRDFDVFAGSDLLFRFTTPDDPLPRGATFAWSTSSGFDFFRVDPGFFGLMPASVVSFGSASSTRVFVAYSGANSLLRLNPVRTSRDELGILQ